MALFYDLQSPVDDGYCDQWSEHVACKVTKTTLVSHLSKCVWMNVSMDMTAAIVVQSIVATGQLISTSLIAADAAEGTSKDRPCRLNTDTLSSRAFFISVSDHINRVNVGDVYIREGIQHFGSASVTKLSCR